MKLCTNPRASILENKTLANMETIARLHGVEDGNYRVRKATLSVGIFLVTWLLIAKKWKYIPIGRPAASALGACLVVSLGLVSPGDALASVSSGTLLTLIGLMIIVGKLDEKGLSRVIQRVFLFKHPTPLALLVRVSILAGLLGALVMNDGAAIFLIQPIADICDVGSIPLQPYAIALVTSANIGSAATIIGNPKNMVVGEKSKISFVQFSSIMAPAAVLCLMMNTLCLIGCYWRLLRGKRIRNVALIISSRGHVSEQDKLVYETRTEDEIPSMRNFHRIKKRETQEREEEADVEYAIRASRGRTTSESVEDETTRLLSESDCEFDGSPVNHGWRIRDLTAFKRSGDDDATDFANARCQTAVESKDAQPWNNELPRTITSSSWPRTIQYRISQDNPIMIEDAFVKRQNLQSFRETIDNIRSQPKLIQPRDPVISDEAAEMYCNVADERMLNQAEDNVYGIGNQQLAEGTFRDTSRNVSRASDLTEVAVRHDSSFDSGNSSIDIDEGKALNLVEFVHRLSRRAEKRRLHTSVEIMIRNDYGVQGRQELQRFLITFIGSTQFYKTLYIVLVSVILIGMYASYLDPNFHIGFSTLTAGVLLLVIDRSDATRVLDTINWALICYLFCIFVVLEGVREGRTTDLVWNSLVGPILEQNAGTTLVFGVFSLFVFIVSLIFTSIPTVMLIGPFVSGIQNTQLHDAAWFLLSWNVTLSGNLTPFGSVAGLIVSEQLYHRDGRISNDEEEGNGSRSQGMRLGEWMQYSVITTVIFLVLGVTTIMFCLQ